MLPDVSMMKMMYSLSTGMPPTEALGLGRASGGQAFHLFGEILQGLGHTPLDDVLHFGVVAGGGKLALQGRQIALKPGQFLFGRAELNSLGFKFPLQNQGIRPGCRVFPLPGG